MIAIVVNSLQGGGAEIQAVRLYRLLRRHGLEVKIFTFHHSASLEMDDEVCAESFYRKTNFVHRICFLKKQLINYDIKLVLAFMPTPMLYLGILRFFRFRKDMFTIGSIRVNPDYDELGFLVKKLRKILYKNLDLIHTQTKASENFLRRRFKVQNIAVIPNLFPDYEIKLQREVAKLPFIYVGRLEKQKNVDFILQSYYLYRKKVRVPRELVIYGSGTKENSLKEVCNHLGIEGVNFMGNVFIDQTIYYSAAATLLASSYEGFPNVLIESISCGTPVISYDCDFGPREIINDSNGILVTKFSKDHFSDALIEIENRHFSFSTSLNKSNIEKQWMKLIKESIYL